MIFFDMRASICTCWWFHRWFYRKYQWFLLMCICKHLVNTKGVGSTPPRAVIRILFIISCSCSHCYSILLPWPSQLPSRSYWYFIAIIYVLLWLWFTFYCGYYLRAAVAIIYVLLLPLFALLALIMIKPTALEPASLPRAELAPEKPANYNCIIIIA